MRDKFNFNSIKSPLVILGPLLLLIALTIRIIFFSLSTNNVPPNSDESLAMLMAEAITRGDFPLLFWAQPYQFPIESYIIALFYHFLPVGAFGARIVPFLFCIASLFGFYFLCHTFTKSKWSWLGKIIVLFPSTYWLIRQSTYFVPLYTTTMTFAWLIPLLFIRSHRDENKIFMPLLGISSGFALSCHLLSLPIVFCASFAFCLGKTFKTALRNTALFIPSFLIGFSPYIFAKLTIPGAYQKVTDTVPITTGIGKLFDPVIKSLLPVTFGIRKLSWPDIDATNGSSLFAQELFPYFFILFLSLACALCFYDFIKRFTNSGWPSLEIQDVMVGTILCSLITASLNDFGDKYRYVLPIVWAFPVVFIHVVVSLLKIFEKNNSINQLFRYLTLSLSLISLFFYTGINLSHTQWLYKKWSHKDYAVLTPDLPNLKPLFTFFSDSKINHCYASWWYVYRINYESDQNIICEQTYNGRFPGWPLRYKDEVDNDKRSAYVFSISSVAGREEKNNFIKALRKNSLTFTSKKVGNMLAIFDIHHTSSKELEKIASTQYRLEQVTGKDNKPKSLRVILSQEKNISLIKIAFKKALSNTRTPNFRILSGAKKTLLTKGRGLHYALPITLSDPQVQRDSTKSPSVSNSRTFSFKPHTTDEIYIIPARASATGSDINVIQNIESIEVFSLH